MHRWLFIVALAACDRGEDREASPPSWPSVHVPEDSTTGSGGGLARLDLSSWPDLPPETTTGEAGSTSSTVTSSPTTGDGTSTTGDTSSSGTTGGSSTSEASTGSTDSTGSTGTGEASSTTGAPPSPCPCDPDAAAAENFCGLAPGVCEATAPGGYCDPNGDTSYADGDWVLGWQEWAEKCA